MAYLWANIAALMGADPEMPGLLDRVQRKTGVGRGIIQRIQGGPEALRDLAEGGKEPSVELRSLVAIANALKVEVWELLKPSKRAADPARKYVMADLLDLTEKLENAELVSLVESVKLANAAKRNQGTPGGTHEEVKVYFAQDRRAHDVHVSEDRRGGGTWIPTRDSITENKPPAGRVTTKKGNVG